MRIEWSPLGRLTDAVQSIIAALANRLTAEDNFGPEGELGQFLGSNGSSSPPSYKDIGTVIRSDPVTLEAIKGDTGPAGPAGAAGATGAAGPAGEAGFMPTYIGPTETFTVPVNRQGLYAVPIVNDGSLVVTGDLVMVD